MEVYVRKVGSKRLWYARCHWFDGAHRREERRSTGIRDDGTAKSREAAEAIGREIERSYAFGGTSAARPTRTLKQALAALVKQQELAGRSAASIEIITEKSLNLFKGFGPERQMHTIDAPCVIDYAAKARKLRAVTSVGRELLILRQAFAAVELDPPQFPELGDPPPSKDRMLELGEQRKLLTAVAGEKQICVMGILQLGGMRKSELPTVREVNWQGRFAHVEGTKTKKADRWVPVPDELYDEMLLTKDAPCTGACGKPDCARRHNWTGFPQWTNIDRDLRLAAKRADIDPVSCNDLRRTYATFMARSGCQPLLLAKYMGTSVKMLESVYARLEKLGEHDHEAVARGVPRLHSNAPATRSRKA